MISKFFKRRSTNQKLDKEQDLKIEESSRLFLEAASSTLNLAKDVSSGLRDKINDYSREIEATSNLIPDALIVTDNKGNIQTINQATIDMFEITLEEAKTSNINMLFKDKNNIAIGIDVLKQVVVTTDIKQSCINKYFGIPKHKEPFCVEIRVNHFNATDSDRYIVLVTDITERIHAQELLLQSEEHFRLFGEASCEVMIIHNDDKILDWNNRLTTLTGFSDADLNTMKMLNLFHPYEREKYFIDIQSPNRSFMSLMITKDNQTFDVIVNDNAIVWHGIPARIKIIRDVSNIVDADSLLKLSKERYTFLTESTFDIVVSYDTNYDLTFTNQTFDSYVGSEPRTTMLEFVDQRDHIRMADHIQKLTFDNPVSRILYRVKYHGQTRWLDWIDSVIFSSEGEIIEYTGVGRDVTDYIRRIKDI